MSLCSFDGSIWNAAPSLPSSTLNREDTSKPDALSSWPSASSLKVLPVNTSMVGEAIWSLTI